MDLTLEQYKNKANYQKNKEKILKRNKNYYWNNREERKHKQREYYQKNKEKILKRNKNYYQVNKQQLIDKEIERQRKKDPYYGIKINSRVDLENRIINILDGCFDGLKAKELYDLLLPFQGVYYLKSLRQLIGVLRENPLLINENGTWKYIG